MTTNKRIHSQVSLTAMAVCLKRAMSFYDKNPHYKTNDYVAAAITPPFLKLVISNDILKYLYRKIFLGNYGRYEYLIARTKLFDKVFKDSSKDTEQVLILGAGFDSRAIRFKEELKHSTIFELDSPITQQSKIDAYKKANIEIPENVKLISIDFNTESLRDKLEEAGFQKNKRSLFLLEGLVMYLDEEAINSTFNLIKEYSGENSIIGFDYLYSSVINRENLYKGEKKMVKALDKIGESYTFGIKKGCIENFLSKYNMSLIENFNPEELGKKFFSNEAGKVFASTIEVYGIALARM